MNNFWLPDGLGKYVYFASLETGTEIEKQLASDVGKLLKFKNEYAKNGTNDFSVKINSALAFLQQIATSEKTKEINAINNYISKLQEKLKNKNIPEKIKEKIQKQIHYLKKIDVQQYNNLDFIQDINIIKKDLTSYKRRLAEINTINTKNSKTINVSNRFEFRAQKQLENFLISISEQSDSSTSIKTLRDRATYNAFQQQMKNINLGLPSNVQTQLYSLIYLDFNNWLENQNQKYTSAKQNKHKKFLKIEEWVSDYFNSENTHLLNLMNNSFTNLYGQQTELLNIIDNLNNVMGINYIDSTTAKDLQIKLENNPNQLTFSFKDKKYSRRQLENLLKTYEANINKNDEERFTFNFHTASSHGNFYEMLLTLINKAANVKGNVGADLIMPLGSFTFSENEQKEQQLLYNLSYDIGEILTEDFNNQTTITLENFNNNVEKQKDLSNRIQNRLDWTIAELDNLTEQSSNNFFITHESLKLYKSVEAEVEDSEFHGREMNILSALTKLYAAPGLSNAMIDSDMLITYLINISDATITHGNNLQPLETYLSLFAGLLMFDDISEIASHAIQQIATNIPQQTSLEQLHVYNINGIYFPISIVLDNLINQINSTVSKQLTIDKDKTAIANIHFSVPENPDISTKESWNQTAENTIQNTKIQIAFFSGFTNFIQDLFSNSLK